MYFARKICGYYSGGSGEERDGRKCAASLESISSINLRIVAPMSRRRQVPIISVFKMVLNKAFVYKAIPVGWPVKGEHLTVEDVGFNANAAPPKGGFTTKNYYAAYDPSQRPRMRDPSIQSYSPAMITGRPLLSVSVIGKVLKSDNSKFKEGTIVLLSSSFTESYSSVPESAMNRVEIIQPREGVPLTAYLGLLGMTGMAAYGSLHEIGQPRKGDVILISAAAGAVGQMVGQIAVREGLHVGVLPPTRRRMNLLYRLLVLSALTRNLTSFQTSSASPRASIIRKKICRMPSSVSPQKA